MSEINRKPSFTEEAIRPSEEWEEMWKEITAEEDASVSNLSSLLSSNVSQSISYSSFTEPSITPVENMVKELVQEEINKHLAGIITKIPDNTKLKKGEILVIKVEVGDMSTQDVGLYLNHIGTELAKQGLTKIIIYPVRYGVGECDFNIIDNSDMIIE